MAVIEINFGIFFNEYFSRGRGLNFMKIVKCLLYCRQEQTTTNFPETFDTFEIDV